MTGFGNMSPEDRAAALQLGRENAAANRAKQAAYVESNTVLLADDAGSIYPDSNAGVGWVLKTTGHVPRYLRDRETAIRRALELGFSLQTPEPLPL